MKNDIMDIKHLLEHAPAQVNHNIPTYVEARVDSEGANAPENVIPLNEVEKRMIIGALDRFAGNRRLASRALNISERTLYRKIKEYGLD